MDSAFLTGIPAKNFGYLGLKDWQEEVVKGVLDGKNAIVIQPTGSGKSLCYQLPPFVGVGTAVIISPTLSLIHDQVENLCLKGMYPLIFWHADIPATYLCSTQRDLQCLVGLLL